MDVKTYIKINDILYPATIGGRMSDRDWDNRATKFIHLSNKEAVALFTDEVEWYIVQETTEDDGNVSIETYDNSEYSILGDITIHKDGTFTITMGQPTAEELLEVILGGIE